MSVKRISDPAILPATEEALKCHLRIDLPDEDILLKAYIEAATAAAESYTRRALITQTWTLTVDEFPSGKLALPMPPLQSVTSVVYYDSNNASQTLDASEYRVVTDSHIGYIEPVTSWPTTYERGGAVVVTYVAGYGDEAENLPPQAVQAIKLYVGQMYEYRENIGPSMSELPMASKWLLDQIRVAQLA